MCIFQSEQLTKLRFWLKNNLANIYVSRSQSVGLSCDVQYEDAIYICQNQPNQPTLPSWRLSCFNMEWFATGVHW